MPIPILSRVQPDSITEFRAAAVERFRDGEVAAAQYRRVAAIYLWGYAAEMTIKAAYFALTNLQPTAIITKPMLDAAKQTAISAHGIQWSNPTNFHNVSAWGQLLINVRASSLHSQYIDLGFAAQVQARCDVVHDLWSEQLRYHKLFVTQPETKQMHDAADWLLVRSSIL